MKVEKIFRVFLIFLAVYLVGDGAIHLLNIRLQSVQNIWPQSALSYAVLLNAIYASFVFLAAILVLVVQKDLKKYKPLILSSGIWSLFHGLLLAHLILSQNFMESFSNYSSLYVWIPFYNQYLLFEAFLAFVYAILAFLYFKSQ